MKNVNRRNFLKTSGAGLIGLTLGGVALRAQAQEKLSPEDPMAVSLGYVENSEQEGKWCKNCLLAQGEGEWLGCGIFPGKKVSASGWCTAWAKRG